MGIPNSKTFFDKVYYNNLHFRKKKGSTNEFGIDVEKIIPEAGEIRLLGNRHKQCAYYQIGMLSIILKVIIIIRC